MNHLESLEVAIIVLNWNRKQDTLRCLSSLHDVSYPSFQIFVVDNASTDGSVDAIHEAFPDVNLLVNDSNLGFADGNNVAIRLALQRGFDAVLLLNNDTVVAPDSVERLAGFMQSQPDAGIVAPAICYLSLPEQVWSAGGSIDWRHGLVSTSFLDENLMVLPDTPFSTGHVSGCCMLVRSEAIRKAGTLDPRFFMYFEETEWCVRIARAGYDVFVEPRARIWHDIAPDQHLGSKAVAYYMTRNQLLFLKTTNAPARAWVSTLYRQVRTTIALFVRPSSLERMRGRVPMVRGIRDFALGRFGAMPAK